MNYQPQVGDTSEGPQTNYYIPTYSYPNGQCHAFQTPLQNTTLGGNPPVGPGNPLGHPPPILYQHAPLVQVNINGPGFGYIQPSTSANLAFVGYPPQGPPLIQAANGQWLPGPYTRQNFAGPNGQYCGTWTGPTFNQHAANIAARADNRPQDMVPGDPDPWRMYTVKELDGGITTRNRYTIDSGDIGKVRWFQTQEGVFYAVIVPDDQA